jgi:hypothetical protein
MSARCGWRLAGAAAGLLAALPAVGQQAASDKLLQTKRAIDETPGLREAVSTTQMLLLTALLLMVFIIGSYFMLQIGRRLRQRDREPSGPTPYVDAWSNYRITDEQIAEYTREDDDAGRKPPPGNADKSDSGEGEDPRRPNPDA